MKRERRAIIGSGISGLTMANLLRETCEITIFEKENETGGLIRCRRVQDCLFHQVGGHVFNSTNEKVLNWFWSFFDKDKEFVKAKRNAKIYLRNRIIGYPIENNIYNLERTEVVSIISELLVIDKNNLYNPDRSISFGDFLQNNFGTTLYNLYFKPYNEKLWQTNIHDISLDWLKDKLPMPDVQQIIESNIFREEESRMVHSSFYYPREGGSQFIVNKLSRNLTIQTGMYVKEISLRDEGICLDGNDVYDKIVYTGDIRALPASIKNILHQYNANVSGLEKLRSNGTSNLFCETDKNDVSWLYLPEPFTRAHRIVYTGNFSDTNSRGSERNTCIVEFSGKLDYELLCREAGMLPGNLTPLAANYEPNSYVIQDSHTRTLVQNAKDVLKMHGIYLLGRFAEWEYYNMDKAIEAAFDLKSKIS